MLSGEPTVDGRWRYVESRRDVGLDERRLHGRHALFNAVGVELIRFIHFPSLWYSFTCIAIVCITDANIHIDAGIYMLYRNSCPTNA